jgi:hypothetical protein
VFDDFDPEVTPLQEFLPESTNGHGSVLITSRRPLEILGTAIQVAPFTIEEGAHFLRSCLDRFGSSAVTEEELASAVTLTKTLGSLPLALTAAAAYINVSQASLTEFLTEFNSLSQRFSSRVTPSPVYGSTLDEAFAPAVAGLSSPATALLQFLAFLNPDGLDKSLVLTEAVTHDDAIGVSDSHSP